MLTDKGNTGVGVGIHTPIKRQPDGQLHTDSRCYNELIIALRAPTVRARPAGALAPTRARDRLPATNHRDCRRRACPHFTRTRKQVRKTQ